MSMLRLMLAVLLLSLPLPASGQVTGDGAAPGVAADAPPPPPSEAEALELLTDVLQDPEARARLIAQLRAAAAGTGVEAPPPPEEEEASVARVIADQTLGVAETVSAGVLELIIGLTDVRGLWAMATGLDWTQVGEVALSLAVVAAVTVSILFALRSILRRVLARIEATAGQQATVLYKSGFAVTGAVIDAGLVVIAWGAGYGLALFLGQGTMDLTQSLYLNAFLLVEVSKAVFRAVLAPRLPGLRLLPMSTEIAKDIYFWLRQIAALMGYGALLLVPIVNLTVSVAAGGRLLLAIVILAVLAAVRLIWKHKDAVRFLLDARLRRGQDDLLARVEAALGAVWHWLAILYVAGLFIVWTTRPADALQFMVEATLYSAIAIAIGVTIVVLITRAIAGGIRLGDDIRTKLPLLEARLNAFVPKTLLVVRGVVVLAVILAVGEIWGVVNATGWLGSEAGRGLIQRLISAGLILLVASALWIGMSSWVEYRLNPAVGMVPTARERTLLALFRNAFLVTLGVISGMLILSEIGVNIAPLLAGAGVLGLAIGFGAQRLVQDIITGAFIQFENAMNEGDVVTAGGVTGAVERLTIRSVGLRDLSGNYHLIPFSAVDSVTNFSKEFGFHVAEIGVAYREDIDEVKAAMQEAFERLLETEHGQNVIAPLEMHGITAFADSAITVRARIKTLPATQWALGRAYNEILKKVFDAHDIEIAFPHMTIYMGQDKKGDSPPLNIRTLTPKRAQRAPSPPDPHAGGRDQARPSRRPEPVGKDTGQPDLPGEDEV